MDSIRIHSPLVGAPLTVCYVHFMYTDLMDQIETV